MTVLLTALSALSSPIQAQEEIIFSPADLIPHEEGYYITGVWVDENEDGIPEFHNQCDDYYELVPQDPQLNHVETGTQQDFTYMKCMIMPDCGPKGTPIDPPVTTGYIQIAPCYYMGTDSASISCILTPGLRNLVSMTLETSSDVSINDSRYIPYFLEYSIDNGVTWEPSFVQDQVATQGGYRITYDTDNTEHVSFRDMINASKETPIVIRLITNDVTIERPYKGQFVKVHYIKILAEKVTESSNAGQTLHSGQRVFFRVYDHTIVSLKDPLKVYNTLGQLAGSGMRVTLPHSGIYVVRSEQGRTQKVYIH